MGIVGGTLKPEIPNICPDFFKPILTKCFDPNPNQRPTCNEIALKFQ